MKRRNFLGLFGGAIAAPLIPAPSLAAAPVYSEAALRGAIMHAKTRGSFSVWGLAQAVKVPVETAEVLMGDLAKRGILGPLQGTTFGGRWATSNVLLRDTLAATQVVRDNTTPQSSGVQTQSQHQHAEVDLSAFLAHLRNVCVNAGMTLHPRCALTS